MFTNCISSIAYNKFTHPPGFLKSSVSLNLKEIFSPSGEYEEV